MKVSQSPGFGLDDADPLDDEQPRAARASGDYLGGRGPACGRRRVLRRAHAARRAHGRTDDLQAGEAAAGRAPRRLPGPSGGRRSP